MDYIDYTDMTEDQARGYLEKLRWPDGKAVCPFCQKQNAARLNGKAHRSGVWKCRQADCRKQFTVTVNTIFHGSHIPLRKWVRAFHLVCCSKKGISALQLQRMLGLKNYKSAWHLAHRIRHAMSQEPLKSKLNGIVESDETYIGSRAHGKGGWVQNKTAVMALVERDGRLRAQAIGRVTVKNLRRMLNHHVDKNAQLMTDEAGRYKKPASRFHSHQTVCHSRGEYSRREGDISVHVNTAESFFALLKRGLYGTFHQCGKQHLQRYVDEFNFRWDRRKATDSERTEAALRAAPGKRLIYRNKNGC